MLSERELSAAIGVTAYGPDGHKIGTVEHFFTDDRTGAPTWVAVSTGLFGTRRSVVPAAEATFDDGELRLPVTRDAVRSAPHVSDEHLDPDAEELLRRHYSGESGAGEDGAPEVGGSDAGSAGTGSAVVGTAAPAADAAPAPAPTGTSVPGPTPGAGPAVGAGPAGGAGPDEETARVGSTARGGDTVRVEESGRAGDTVSVAEAALGGAAAGGAVAGAGGAMTRSEEQLRVGTERVATTRARLVKYVVTEEVTLTVPIRREEIRVEQVPVDAPDPVPGESLAPDRGPGDGGTASGLPEEIVLHAERPVVSVEVVPVERVRLRTDVVTDQEQVTEQVRREQIVVDQDRRPGA
ncbi:YsnF/AvaK domain-containing protein [Geodermatophilus sp. SYSU D00703]